MNVGLVVFIGIGVVCFAVLLRGLFIIPDNHKNEGGYSQDW